MPNNIEDQVKRKELKGWWFSLESGNEYIVMNGQDSWNGRGWEEKGERKWEGQLELRQS